MPGTGLPPFLVPVRDLVRRLAGPPAVAAVRRRLPGRRALAGLAWGYLQAHPRRYVIPTAYAGRLEGDTGNLPDCYVYLFGVWEPAVSRLVAERLRPGDLFVDAGAYCGHHTLLASRRVGPSGTVVAIEASPDNFARLEANLRRNRAANVRALNVAVHDRAATVDLFRGPAGSPSRTTLDRQAGFELECRVEARPLAEILAPGELERARLIKLDVEGVELEVLEGLVPHLGRARADLELVVEVNRGPSAHLMDQPERVIELMGRAGFTCAEIPNPYRLDFYLRKGEPPAPLPIERVAAEQADLLFSRRPAGCRPAAAREDG